MKCNEIDCFPFTAFTHTKPQTRIAMNPLLFSSGPCRIIHVMQFYSNNNLNDAFMQESQAAELSPRITRRRKPQKLSRGGRRVGKIPKKKTTMEAESEDEERGITPTSLPNCTRKFSVEADCKIHSLINSRVLIPSDMSSLSDSFEKLIISSVSKQLWAKHSSALSCYYDF